jgi:hypothetical protein
MTDTTIMRFVAEIPKTSFTKNVVLNVLDQLATKLDVGELSVEDFMADSSEENIEVIDILFDGPPPVAEDLSGHSVGIGEWVDLGDGFHRLRIPVSAAKVRR